MWKIHSGFHEQTRMLLPNTFNPKMARLLYAKHCPSVTLLNRVMHNAGYLNHVNIVVHDGIS